LKGPKLFAQNCASCHRFDGHDGLGNIPEDPQSASDLNGFASREWLTGLLDPERVDSTNYFGATRFRNGRMVRFVKRDVAGFDDEQKENLRKGIIALSAGAQLPMQAELDVRDEVIIQQGRELLGYELGCTDCHAYPEPDDLADAPTLVDYGTREWLIRFIGNPAHPLLYGDRNDRMPAYSEEQILDQRQIGLIADWLRGDWYRLEQPFP
jgi:ubiquinol-cytochrome c reductase cytochrome b subunit